MEYSKGLMKECRFCGKEFRSTKERRVCCSEKCSQNVIRERQKEYSRVNKEAIYKRRTTCKYCGGKFKMGELKDRCCSDYNCIEEKKKEKIAEKKKRYYNKHIKRTTKKYKKRDAEKSKLYRRRHAEEINQRDRSRKKEKREWIDNYKKTKKCMTCGEDKFCCLVFHHNGSEEKDFTVAAAVSRGYGKKRIMAEMEKCDVLCSNCHLELHYKENNENYKNYKL